MPPLAHELGSLGLLVLAAVAGGRVASAVRLPPLLGMLLAGLALRNLPGQLLEALPDRWSVALRLTALAVILLRAGLGLDLEALRRLRASFLRLAVLPNLTEATTVALAAHLLLDLPPAWAALLGFVVAAVSPAVVVPSMLELQAKGYGTKKGIPTMVLAAASVDDVIAITGFGATLSLIFAGRGQAGLTESLLRAPVELILGVGLGMMAGRLCGRARSAPVLVRFGLLFGLGLVGVFGGWALGLTGGGSLAAMTMGAVAGRAWGAEVRPVAASMGRVWTGAQPILFGLIGAAVSLAAVEPRYVGRGLLIIAAGLVIRLLVTFFSAGSGRFTTGERLFIALAWIPKATVQAAIGALALDLARQYEAGAAAEEYGIQVVTIAVLAILVTAPVGAIAISWSGPRWLDR